MRPGDAVIASLGLITMSYQARLGLGYIGSELEKECECDADTVNLLGLDDVLFTPSSPSPVLLSVNTTQVQETMTRPRW